MDRKLCVLLYSNYSKASLDLINYIKKIPLDFPTIVGLTMICIDNPDFKIILHKNKIDYVPTLLVEYYNGSKQKYEREYIYMWIDQIMGFKKINEDENQNTDQDYQGAAPIAATALSDMETKTQNSSKKEVRTSGSQITQINKTLISNSETRISGKKPDISSIAIEMQKSRDLELAEIKEQQKPI